MEKFPISVTILTLNEEEHIDKTLRSVEWAADILVVDSGSKDRTVEIVKKCCGARLIRQDWLGYGRQKNFAQSQARFDWVLNLDADERVPNKLALEIQEQLQSIWNGKISALGISFPRKTFYLGRWIQYGGWYPNQTLRLADRRRAIWTEPHVHEKLQVDGPVLLLKNPLDHFAFSSIRDQVMTNLNFSYLGASDLKQKGVKPRKTNLILKPLGKFFETYFLKKGCFDGLAGFIISVNAAYSMFLKQAFLMEPRIKRDEGSSL